jgi:glycosyltransferase involved in cell wall biosynthesis
VLADHVRKSRGGLHYLDGDEFTEALDLLVREEGLRSALGENGRRYVLENYRWDAVMAKYRGLIASVSRR